MFSGCIWLETRCLRVQTGISNSSTFVEMHKNSDSTSVNYNIIHTWGGKSPHCKDPFHTRQKSTPALLPCPALTITVQRRWPEKPELDFYWRIIWVLCILTYVHISQVSRCVFTRFLIWRGWNASKLSLTEYVREPQCVSYINHSILLLSKLVWAAWTYFRYIQRIWSPDPGGCLYVCEMIPHRALWEVRVKNPGVISVAPASVWPPVLGWPAC